MNILFIMVDQLRFDYLGCTGHPTIKTPNIDKLAEQGVRFNRAYVQSPVCGPSRMSTYTGRYCHSHGATWNGIPLGAGEKTLGDHLRMENMDTVLCGKTHMVPDIKGMKRLGIDPQTPIGKRISECGFDVWERHDGEFPKGLADKPSAYQDYLRSKGYTSSNPWHDFANSSEGDTNSVQSGWLLKNSSKPARINKNHSESAWLTDRAIDYMTQADGTKPWCLHVSYIKPHWPYIAPAPYHKMYGKSDLIPVVRSQDEKETDHPVLSAFQNNRVAKVYSREGVRDTVVPAYMGLITEIDDQVGRLMAHLEQTDQREDTLIVFTSDHGDYLGDHWLGEKELFHDASVRVPLIISDPRAAADETRGKVSQALVESIDLAPTFVEYAGGVPENETLEGMSLRPLVENNAEDLRTFVISEFDYALKSTRVVLGQPIGDSRLAMIFDGRYKLIHAEGFRSILFDLETDPNELHDLGKSDEFADIRANLTESLNAWYRRHHNRTTISDTQIVARENGDFRRGIYLGFWDEADLEESERQGRTGN